MLSRFYFPFLNKFIWECLFVILSKRLNYYICFRENIFGMWRSPVSVHGWGPCGRRFKSCHPDQAEKWFTFVNHFFISENIQNEVLISDQKWKSKKRSFTFLFATKGLLGFCKSCWCVFKILFWSVFSLKNSASLFYLQQRVYKDSINPVDARLKYYFEVFLI